MARDHRRGTAKPLSRGRRRSFVGPDAEDGLAKRQAVSEAKYQGDPRRFAGLVSDFARWAAPKLPPFPGARLLELGCGPGRDLAFYAERGFACTGVDFAPTAIERARERFAHLPEPTRSRGRFVLGDAASLLRSQAPASWDGIVANLVYPTFEEGELKSLFGEVTRVLRPHGVHAYAVRSVQDPRAKEGELVGPDTRNGGPHDVPYRFFSATTLDAIVPDRFTKGERAERKVEHLLYAADTRNPDAPAPRTS